jgi:hypothetical protein
MMEIKLLLFKSLMYFSALLLLLAFYLPSAAQIQPTMGGTVVDSFDAPPIHGTMISLEKTSSGAQRDASANFAMEVADISILLVHLIGYTENMVNCQTAGPLVVRLGVYLKEAVIIRFSTQKGAEPFRTMQIYSKRS